MFRNTQYKLCGIGIVGIILFLALSLSKSVSAASSSLSNLTSISGITLDQSLTPGIVNYTASSESITITINVIPATKTAQVTFSASEPARLISFENYRATFALAEGFLNNQILIKCRSGNSVTKYTIIVYKPVKKINTNAKGPKLIGEYKEGKIHHHAKQWDQIYKLADRTKVRLRWKAYTGKLISNSSRDDGVTWTKDYVEIDNFRRGDKMNYIEIFQVSDGSIIVFQYQPQIVFKKNFITDEKFKQVHDFPKYSVDLHEIKVAGKPRLIIPRNNDGKGFNQFSLSEDLGDTWYEIKLPIPPSDAGFLVEPNLIELLDGRLWVTYRSQVGQAMYEMYSSDGGKTWSPLKVGRFATGRTWQRSYRVPEGPHKNSLVYLWANMRQSAQEDRNSYRPGRQALHMAISNDDGKTWNGFRQVNVYAFRYGEQPLRLDRGATDQEIEYHGGKYFIYSGNGNHYTNMGRHVSNPFFKQREIEVDLNWLYQNFAYDDFSSKGIDNDFENGELSQWLVFKRVGKIKSRGHSRTRIPGAKLIEDSGKKVLQIRRTLNKYEDLLEPPDVATWNIPNGKAGVLTTFIKLSDTFKGARIRLNDQLYWNSDGYYSKSSIMTPQFNLEITPSGKVAGKGLEASEQMLKVGTWHKLQLSWSVIDKSCSVWLDGHQVGSVSLENTTENGISNIRIESTANRNTEDKNGFYIRSVESRVSNY